MTQSISTTVTPNAWQVLRQFTAARIALGRAGNSLPTNVHLQFQLAHAQARDAVQLVLDWETLAQQIEALGLSTVSVQSRVNTHQEYLQRPDWGRRLSTESIEYLAQYQAQTSSTYDVVVVVGDGLSSLAIERNAVPMVQKLQELCSTEHWTLAPIVLAKYTRVALGDEIGQVLKAKMVVMLIGERPGLSSPDSLGIYFTWNPTVGLTDAARNCISNVRLEGLSYPTAIYRLGYLMREAVKRQLSGVNLKDEADMPLLGTQNTVSSSFLLPTQ